MKVSPQSTDEKINRMLYCHRFFSSPVLIVDCRGKKKFPDENMRECNGNDMQATASLPHLAVKLSSV